MDGPNTSYTYVDIFMYNNFLVGIHEYNESQNHGVTLK